MPHAAVIANVLNVFKNVCCPTWVEGPTSAVHKTAKHRHRKPTCVFFNAFHSFAFLAFFAAFPHTMAAPKPNADLLADVSKGAQLKHVQEPVNASLAAAKLQLEVKKGADLTHVEAPKTGVADSVKQAFVEDQKDKKK